MAIKVAIKLRNYGRITENSRFGPVPMQYRPGPNWLKYALIRMFRKFASSGFSNFVPQLHNGGGFSPTGFVEFGRNFEYLGSVYAGEGASGGRLGHWVQGTASAKTLRNLGGWCGTLG